MISKPEVTVANRRYHKRALFLRLFARGVSKIEMFRRLYRESLVYSCSLRLQDHRISGGRSSKTCGCLRFAKIFRGAFE
jgi:hypothetical protein